MKRLICYCLILCFVFMGLPSCAPQAPTADVHAVKLGDTEKQVIEKAGYPDEYVGRMQDIYLYYLNNSPVQYKVLWFQDGMVSIIATAENGSFAEWNVAETYQFESLANPKQLSFWKDGMERYDIIAKLGFGYEEHYSGFGVITAVYKYSLPNGGNLQAILSVGSLSKVVWIDTEGSETILWQKGTVKKDGSYI